MKRKRKYWKAALTPSLPQPVKFPGWKIHRRACKTVYFPVPITSTFNAVCFDANPFTCQWKDFHQKGWRVSNFAFSLAICKQHHGSEGVKAESNLGVSVGGGGGGAGGGRTVLYTFVNAGVGSHSTEVRVAGSLHRLKQNSSIHYQNIFLISVHIIA